MPLASPRKSSISSGKGSPTRPRYLGIEVAGEHSPPPSAAAWEPILRRRLAVAGLSSIRLRVVRAEGPRAIVEVDHRFALAARAAWGTTPADPSEGVPLAPRRTWGTLRGAKSWLRSAGPPVGPRRSV